MNYTSLINYIHIVNGPLYHPVVLHGSSLLPVCPGSNAWSTTRSTEKKQTGWCIPVCMSHLATAGVLPSDGPMLIAIKKQLHPLRCFPASGTPVLLIQPKRRPETLEIRLGTRQKQVHVRTLCLCSNWLCGSNFDKLWQIQDILRQAIDNLNQSSDK